jgi:hypothetical protein
MTTRIYRRRIAVAAAAIIAAGATTVPVAPVAQAGGGWGAIAYAFSGAWGRAQDYPTAAAAQATALNFCGYTDCKVLVTFDACGAVAANGFVRGGGYGPNLGAAMAAAQREIGGGWIDSWACN